MWNVETNEKMPPVLASRQEVEQLLRPPIQRQNPERKNPVLT